MAKATIEDVRAVFTGMRVSLFAGSVAPDYLKGVKTKMVGYESLPRKPLKSTKN